MNKLKLSAWILPLSLSVFWIVHAQAVKVPAELFDKLVGHIVNFSCSYFHRNDFFMSVGTQEGQHDKRVAVVKVINNEPFIEFWSTNEAVVNGKYTKNNPLSTASAQLIFPTSEGVPLVVTKEQPWSVFIAHNRNLEGHQKITEISNFPDAHGQQTRGIIALSYCANGRDLEPHVIAAVKPHDGEFGHKGSGIACYAFHKNSVKSQIYDEKKKEMQEITLSNPTWDLLSNSTELSAAYPFDCVALGIDIQDGLQGLEENKVTLCWNPVIERLYIGVCATTKADATDEQGVCALAMGKIHDGKFHLEPVLPTRNKALNNLIMAFGANKRVAVHNLMIFATKRGHSYLIGVGGVGEDSTTRRQVFAVPLVDYLVPEDHEKNRREVMRSSSLVGTIASAQAVLHQTTIKNSFGYSLTAVRCAHDQVRYDESYHADVAAVAVGGGLPLPGPIANIKIVEDVVLAAISEADEGKSPGLFYSQALYDGSGHIAGWTGWRRTMGIHDAVLDFTVDVARGTIWYTARTAHGVIMRQTGWYQYLCQPVKDEAGQLISLAHLLAAQFDVHEGGILNWQETDAMALITGNKKIVAAQVVQHTTEGMPGVQQEMQIVAFSDETLHGLGPLMCATMVNKGLQHWLVVGGARGLAVLSDAQGNGPLENEITLLGARWKSGELYFNVKKDFTFVKKLIATPTDLYIVTDQAVYQAAHWKTMEEFAPKIIAHSSQIGVIFDCCVIDQLVLLASGTGLWKNEIKTEVKNNNILDWRKVDLSHVSGAVQKLVVVRGAGPSKQIAQVYALSYAPNKHQTTVHALSVDTRDQAYEQDRVIDAIPEYEDYTGKESGKPLLSSNSLRSLYATDGMLCWLSCPARPGQQAETLLVPALNRSLASYKRFMCHAVGMNQPGQNIAAIVNSDLLETWVVAGESGLTIAQ